MKYKTLLVGIFVLIALVVISSEDVEAQVNQIAPDNITSCYDMNNLSSSIVEDFQNNNEGTADAGISLETGSFVSGGNMDFDGSSDIDIGSGFWTTSANGDRGTVCLWVQHDSYPTEAFIWNKAGGTNSGKAAFGDNKFTWVNAAGSASEININVAHNSETNWHAECRVWSPSGARLYVNGTEIGSDSTSSDLRFDTADVHLGGNNNDGFMNGNQDEVHIWNINLSSAQVNAYWQGPDNDGTGQNCSVSINGLPEPDTTPAEITLGNLTSEGGLGYAINLTSPYCFGLANCVVPRTNDTTPTFFFTSNENAKASIIDRNNNLNFTDITKGSSTCSTTGVLRHICTLDLTNATDRFGIHNFSVSLNDSEGNQNRTATLFFSVNITNPISPNTTLISLEDKGFVFSDINDTGINFTFNGLSKVDANFTVQLYIDGILKITNTSYRNGTNVTYLIDETTIGSHNWYVNSTDSFNNKNQSFINTFEVRALQINFTLNEYPNNTIINTPTNVQFNFTINFSENIDTCILFINSSINSTNKSLIVTKSKIILNGTNLSINNDYIWKIGCNTSTGLSKNSSDVFNLFVYDALNVSYSQPTVANASVINNASILINVTTHGKVLNFTLEWSGINESVTFNETLNIVINKTGLSDSRAYHFKVYINDTSGKTASTNYRNISTNFLGLDVTISTEVDFFFVAGLLRIQQFFGNDTVIWAGNNTAVSLFKTNIAGNVTLYNNGTIVNQGKNFTMNFVTGTITITNLTGGATGDNNASWITDKLNISYNFFNGNVTLQTLNLTCSGQNDSLGCLTFSTISAATDLNLSLEFNITNDPVRPKMIEDFSIDARNWSIRFQRSNNTRNRSIVNASVVCMEIQSRNQSGLIQYRFNNSVEIDYINKTPGGVNVSLRINMTFNCSGTNSVIRILNGTQRDITGFDFFNFSWKGDNTTNVFNISLTDQDGTKVTSTSYSLANIGINHTGFSLGNIKNITQMNITVSNRTGTLGLNNFEIDSLRLTNSTHNQSQYLTMYASCTGHYFNATVLVPGRLTPICKLSKGLATKFVWLFQDFINPFKGIEWVLSYNATVI